MTTQARTQVRVRLPSCVLASSEVTELTLTLKIDYTPENTLLLVLQSYDGVSGSARIRECCVKRRGKDWALGMWEGRSGKGPSLT